jgi:hypothetical protein
MMRLSGILITFGLILGISEIAVRIGDRDLFVSTPAVVAEGFVREVILERYAQARAYLADPRSMTKNDLRDFRKRLIGSVGPDPSDFETEVESKDRARARVKVTLIFRDRSDAFAFDLEFDSASWKIVKIVR